MFIFLNSVERLNEASPSQEKLVSATRNEDLGVICDYFGKKFEVKLVKQCPVIQQNSYWKRTQVHRSKHAMRQSKWYLCSGIIVLSLIRYFPTAIVWAKLLSNVPLLIPLVSSKEPRKSEAHKPILNSLTLLITIRFVDDDDKQEKSRNFAKAINHCFRVTRDRRNSEHSSL